MPTQDSYPALAALDPTTYVTGFYTSGGQLVTVKVPFAFIYGNKWNVGSGAPTIQGIATGDLYLDQTTGDVWRWNQTALNWGSTPFMNIVNGEFTWPLWVPSKPTSSQVVGALDSPWNGSITTNFQNCYANADVAATASTVFSITQNGGQIGTLTFGAGQTVGTFSTGGPFNINKSDVIRVIAPASQDATLSGVRISMVFAVGGTVGATALLGLALQKANNLSDVANVPASRHSLGLDTVDSPTFTQLSLNYSGAGTTLTATSSGSANTIHVTDTGVNGVGITMTGNGATTPTKTMRVNSGHWQIVNNAYSAVVFDVDDSGNFTTNGGGGTVGSFVTTGQASLAGTVGHESLRAVPVGSAVNWLQVAGAVTGSAVTMQAAGSDTNVALNISSKGASPIQFWTNSIGTAQFVVNDTPGANRYLTVTGSNGGNPTIGASAGSVAFSTNVVVNGTFDTTGQTSLAGAVGAEALRAITVGSAVNWVQVNGATTGNSVGIGANGADTNVGIGYSTKGNGSHVFYTEGYTRAQCAIIDVASAVNYLQLQGASTGNGPGISAQGSDTNVELATSSKGTGRHSFWTGVFSRLQMTIADVPSAVNYAQVQGAPTNNGPIFSAQGSDTNINLNLQAKGTGSVVVGTGGGSQLVVANAASAVNYVQVSGSPAGGGPAISVQGSDTNIQMSLYSKGNANIVAYTNGGVPQFVVQPSATATRYLTVVGSTTNPTIGTSAGSVAFSSPVALNTTTAHSVLLGQGTNNVNSVGPSATTGQALISQGASADPVFGYPTGTLINVQRFTSSGTYTPTAGTNTAIIEGCGGGGGGGATPATSSTQIALGGGGGTGAWGRVRVTAPTTQTVTIGSGGAGGAAGTNTGTAGGQTSIGTYLVCPGGVAGGASGVFTFASNMLVTGGIGSAIGGAATATTSATALYLSGGLSATVGFSVYNSSIAIAAAGASSPFGAGGGYVVTAAGINGTGFGAGGSGAAAGPSAAAAAGGSGSPGFITVYEYA